MRVVLGAISLALMVLAAPAPAQTALEQPLVATVYQAPRVIELATPIGRIALLGCIRQYEPIPALRSYVDAKPDLTLWLGDNIYVDTQDNPDLIGQGYAALGRAPYFNELRAMGQQMFTWDDHDYGDNDAGADYPLKAESTQYFSEFWGLAGQLPHADDGIYYDRLFAFEGKRLHVIMLDVRSHRDAPDGAGDILGDRQWLWLEGALQVEADLTLIVSGSQILLDKETGSETWDQYPKSIERLYDLIRRSRQDGILFVTGDQHYAEAARDRDALDLDAIELQFAGVNQTETPENNSYRDSPAAISLHSMGLIDIQWVDDSVNKAHLVYRTTDTATGNTEFTYRVNFNDIRMQMDFPSDAVFRGTHEVQIGSRFPRLQVRYTLDGSSPDTASALYAGPIPISRSSTVTAAYFDPAGFKRSRDFEAQYSAVELRPPVESSKALGPGLRYEYHEGVFASVPDRTFLPAGSRSDGVSHDLRVDAIARRADHYAIWFEGFLEAPSEGLYRLTLTSDDGSRLYLGDDLVVDNDGSHAPRARSGLVALAPGLHPMRIGYFEDYSGEQLSLALERFDDGHFVPVSAVFHHAVR